MLRKGKSLSSRRRFRLESLERRDLMAADPLPVLMVVADQTDFYYQEYGDTRAALEADGIEVRVAATTTLPTYPHQNTGEGATSGRVDPDLALADVNASDYSAIVFVGGWGSSMYQYDFPGNYIDTRYNGDPGTKATVNDLIGDFVAQDKYVTAICHGTTVLAWARVDGVSPVDGKQVSVPWIGSPAGTFHGQWYGYFELMAYPQLAENGAIPNLVSGQYGDPNTVADDVIVDGKIITAENYDSANMFGHVIAQHVIADANVTDGEPAPEDPPPPVEPVNHAPQVANQVLSIQENSAFGALVGSVLASDADAGQTLTYTILGGNTSNAFAIDPDSGAISVANSLALDFETTSLFELQIGVTDNGTPPLSASATVSINLIDVNELPPSPVNVVGNDLVVNGTLGDDRIYVWTSGAQAFAWMNGEMFGPHTLPSGGHVRVFGGSGNDQIYGTDAHIPLEIYGEAGHDLITGGYADDVLDGGDGWDRIWGNQGDDVLIGGSGNDQLDGRDGNDVVVGGDGDDSLYGQTGRDLLIGGLGFDRLDGGSDEDLLIGEATDYDTNAAALLAIMSEWTSAASLSTRATNLANGLPTGQRLRWGSTVHNDGVGDCLNGGTDPDWYLMLTTDCQYFVSANDLVSSGS